MTHGDAFLQAIIENHDDDTPRLVYADWLEEHDQADRADFIRVQVELSQMAVFNDRRRLVQARQQQLLATHGARWLMQEWPLASDAVVDGRTFDRGFVATLSLCGREIGDAGLRTLARSPRLALVTALDLRKNRIGAPGLRALADSPYLAGLLSLDLRENLFRMESLKVLAASPHLLQLRVLLVRARGTEIDLFRQHGKDVAVYG